MADNRIQVKIRGTRTDEYARSSGGNQARAEAHIVEFRNNLRSAFPSPRFVVSDIARWVGVTGTLGYAFLFRDTTEGCEWLFGWASRSDANTQGWYYQMWGNGNSTTMGTYFRQYGNSTWYDPNTTTATGLIHFNYDYAGSTYGFGFNNTTTLTYTGGDFSTPGTSPYSNLAGFMPSTTGRYHGVELTDGLGTSQYDRKCLTYDLSKGVMCFDVTAAGNMGAYNSYISGKKLFPTNAQGGLASGADTRQDGFLIIPRNPGSTSMGSTESTLRMLVMFVRADGTTIETLGRASNILNNFNRDNYLSGGNVQIRKLEVGVTGYIKGYLDWEIVNESFPYNDAGFLYMPLALPDLDNPMMHDHPQFTRFWKKDAAPFHIVPEVGLPTS